MLKTREELEKELKKFISYSNNKTQQSIIDNFAKKNFLPGDVLSIFSGTTHLSSISQVFLYLFTKYLFEVTDDSVIDPKKYFTEAEIKEGNKFKQTTEEKEKYPLVFSDVIRIAPDHFITYLSAQEIAKLYNKNIIKYNFETQRDAKIKEYKDRIIQEININKTSVQEIRDLLVGGMFITNFITLNILQNGEEEFDYDERNRELTIIKGEINPLDGFHRTLGIIEAIQQNPELKYITGVYITNFDVNKAHRLIVQEDKKNKINRKYIKTLDLDNCSNKIATKLNEDSRSYLSGKISILKNSIVDYVVLSEAISYEFAPKETVDVVKYSKYLIDGINYIFELKPEFLAEKQVNTVWIAIIALLKKVYNAKDWKLQINKTIKKINFGQFKEEKNVNRSVVKSVSGIINQL